MLGKRRIGCSCDEGWRSLLPEHKVKGICRRSCFVQHCILVPWNIVLMRQTFLAHPDRCLSCMLT